jgi:hypothetical protein
VSGYLLEHNAIKRAHAILLIEQHRLEHERPIDLPAHAAHRARLREHIVRLRHHRQHLLEGLR